ncbi:hypothetical protein DXG01_008116, partial [Tephrocybe rancida]
SLMHPTTGADDNTASHPIKPSEHPSNTLESVSEHLQAEANCIARKADDGNDTDGDSSDCLSSVSGGSLSDDEFFEFVFKCLPPSITGLTSHLLALTEIQVDHRAFETITQSDKEFFDTYGDVEEEATME